MPSGDAVRGDTDGSQPARGEGVVLPAPGDLTLVDPTMPLGDERGQESLSPPRRGRTTSVKPKTLDPAAAIAIGLIGYMPLQLPRFDDTPLQFIKYETCHYNSMTT